VPGMICWYNQKEDFRFLHFVLFSFTESIQAESFEVRENETD
jgi:hypothetical protein